MQTLTFVSEQRPANGNKTKQVYVAEFVTSDINTLQFAAATDSRIPNKSSLDIYARIDADLPWVHVKSYIPLPSAFLQTFDIPAGLQVRIESSEPGISATVVTATAPSGGSSSSGSGITPEQMQQITAQVTAQFGPELSKAEAATIAANQAAANATTKGNEAEAKGNAAQTAANAAIQAAEGIQAIVTEKVQEQLPSNVASQLPSLVDASLPTLVSNKVAEAVPSAVEEAVAPELAKLPTLVTNEVNSKVGNKVEEAAASAAEAAGYMQSVQTALDNLSGADAPEAITAQVISNTAFISQIKGGFEEVERLEQSGAGVFTIPCTITNGKEYILTINRGSGGNPSFDGIYVRSGSTNVQTVSTGLVILDGTDKVFDFTATADGDAITTGYINGPSIVKKFVLEEKQCGLADKVNGIISDVVTIKTEQEEFVEQTTEIVTNAENALFGERTMGGQQLNPYDNDVNSDLQQNILFSPSAAANYDGVIDYIDVFESRYSNPSNVVTFVVLRPTNGVYNEVSRLVVHAHPGNNHIATNIPIKRGDCFGASNISTSVSTTMNVYSVALTDNISTTLPSGYGRKLPSVHPHIAPRYDESVIEQMMNEVVHKCDTSLVPNKNLYNKDDDVMHLSTKDGGYMQSGGLSCAFISVEADGNYAINSKYTETRYLLLLNADSEIVSSVIEKNLPSTGDGGVFIHIPDGVTTMVLSTQGRQDTLQVERGVHNTTYEPFTLVEHPSYGVHGDLTDIKAKVCVLGDSTSSTTMGAWYMWIKDKFSSYGWNNIGQGSATYMHREHSTEQNGGNFSSEDNIITNQVNRLVKGVQEGTMDYPDIVLILAGINDTGRGMEALGDADVTALDTTDYTTLSYTDDRLRTMCGGIRMCLELMHKHLPNTRVILASPLNVQETEHLPLTHKARSEQQKIAAYLGADFLDLTSKAGISHITERVKYYTEDGVHPSMAGGRRIADVIGNYLMSITHKPLYDVRKYAISGKAAANATIRAWAYMDLGTVSQMSNNTTTADADGNWAIPLVAGRYRIDVNGVQKVQYLDLTKDTTLDLV